MLSATAIVNLHDQLVDSWHLAADGPDGVSPAIPLSDWLASVARQHRANFDLWHIEDEARAPGVPTLNWPRSSTASTEPTSSATTWPKIWTLPSGLARAPEPARSNHAAQLRVSRPHHRPALDSGAQDLPHPRRSGTVGAPPGHAAAIASASPSSSSSARTWPRVSMPSGAKPLSARADSSSTAS